MSDEAAHGPTLEPTAGSKAGSSSVGPDAAGAPTGRVSGSRGARRFGAALAVAVAAAGGAAFMLQPTAPTAASAHEVRAGTPAARPAADFGGVAASVEARELADWVVASGDHREAPFAIVDKVEARLFVFGAEGRLIGASPVLLGLARGDDSVPGIGDRPIRDIRAEERTTPAGRFVAAPGANLQGEHVIWVDYDNAISMHSVRATVASERRLDRLASPVAADHRISYGCINVPADFFARVARPAFAVEGRMIYVLPETRSWRTLVAGAGSAPASARTAAAGSRGSTAAAMGTDVAQVAGRAGAAFVSPPDSRATQAGSTYHE